jgi:hypothetical protein
MAPNSIGQVWQGAHCASQNSAMGAVDADAFDLPHVDDICCRRLVGRAGLSRTP